MEIPFEFKAVDSACLEATKVRWMAYAEEHQENVNSSFYEGCFATCSHHLPENRIGDGQPALYGVFDSADDVASALINLVHARPRSENSWLKMLSVYVAPELDAAETEPDISRLAWIAATAITGAIKLTESSMPARELKIWANVPMTREFVTAVKTAFLNERYELSSHGNWLVVRKNLI